MIVFGRISDIDPEKGLARVEFDADGIVSDWLPLVVRGAKDTKVEFPLDIDEHVACLMDPRCEDGVILGAIYSGDVEPDAKSKDKYQVKFGDGLTVTYDREEKILTGVLGDVELVMTENGYTLKKSTDTLKKILLDLIDQIKLITVTTPNGPSGTPINATAFDPIKQSVANLLEN